jgi:hypothetical protein
MIDHENTCKNIYVQYLTLTFISRSNLGQNLLKVTKPAHSDLCTLYVLVILAMEMLAISMSNPKSKGYKITYGYSTKEIQIFPLVFSG